MSRFKVGQKVVCTGSKGHINNNCPKAVKNKIYRIIEIEKDGVEYFLSFDELGGVTNGYNENNFAPIIEDGSTKELTEEIIEEGVLEELKIEEMELN